MARHWHFVPFERDGQKIYARVTAWVDVLPNERRPDYRVPFPAVRNWNSIKITFGRSQCFGTCPAYKVVIHGDGTIDYHGEAFVAIRGDHHGNLPRAVIEELVEQFHKAKFFWLFDHYAAEIVDNPMQEISIAFDGRSKSVFDSAGEMVGLPTSVRNLEDEIDQLVGIERWTKGNSETGPSLVAEGWDFRSRSCENRSMVMGVARLGTAQALRDLLADGAPVGNGCQDKSGGFLYGPETEIEAAARRGQEDMVEALVNAGASRDAKTFRRALVQAAAAGNLAAVKTIRSALPFGQDGFKSEPGDAALRAGAASCNPQVVQYILDTTTITNVNGIDADGDTALLKAASTADDQDKVRAGVRCEIAVQLLLKAGASVNARDSSGFTALFFAQLNPDLTKVLITAGADVNTRDLAGETPLMGSWDPRVTRLLLEAGADPDIKNSDGKTALEMDEKDERAALRECARVIRAWTAEHPRTAQHK
jgi:ankyrin repeat protein